MSKTLYVGNLPWSTTEEELKSIFSNHGTVYSARIISDRNTGRSKGFGFVEVDEKTYKVLSFKEKQKTEKKFVNAGMYIFNKKIFDFIPEAKNCSLEYDILPNLKDVYSYITEKKFIDIGTVEKYEKAKNFFSQLWKK